VLFEQPSDRFVATFLGEASFLPDPDSSGLVMMARPHDLTLAAGAGPDVIAARRYLGATWRYTVRRSDGSDVEVESAGGPGITPREIGDLCTVVVDAGHALHRLPA